MVLRRVLVLLMLTAASPAGAQSSSPLAAVQACLARGDYPCVIRVFEVHDGRPLTPTEMRLLIEAYQAVGNQPRMLDTMERFVQRFPTDPRSGQYGRILTRHGR